MTTSRDPSAPVNPEDLRRDLDWLGQYVAFPNPDHHDRLCEAMATVVVWARGVAARYGAVYSGPASDAFWERVNAVKGTYGEAVYSEACKLQEAEGRLLKILADEDEARGGPPPTVADDLELRARLEEMFARIDDFRERMRRQTELPPASDPFWTTPLGQSVRRTESEGGDDV